MLQFNEALSSAKNFVYSHTSEVGYLKNNINRASRYMYDFKKDHPDCAPEELLKLLYQDLQDSVKAVFDCSSVKKGAVMYEASSYLLRHPEKIAELLNRIEKEGIEDERIAISEGIYVSEDAYESDFETSLLTYVLHAKSDYEKELAKQDPKLIELLKDFPMEKRNSLKAIPLSKRRSIEAMLPLVKGDYSERIQNYIKLRVPNDERIFKCGLVKSIVSITDVLRKYGCMDTYTKNYNEQMSDLGLPELSIPEQSTKDNYGISSLLSEGYLSGLSLNQLLVLNHFYLNRVSKEFQHIRDAYFVIHSQDLYHQIYRGKKNIGYSLDSGTLSDELLKLQMLRLPTRDFYNKFSRRIQSDGAEQVIDKETLNVSETYAKNLIQKDFVSFINSINSDWGTNYSQTFYPDASTSFKGNAFSNDLLHYINLYGGIYSSYFYKDYSSNAIMARLLHSDDFQNWGYVPEFNENGENTIEDRSKMILIGVDCPGLNRPIYTHEPSSFVKDFLRTYTGNSIIPVYEGFEDFTVTDSIRNKHPYRYKRTNLLRNNLVVPLTTRQKKFFKSARKMNSTITAENYRFFNHIESLTDSRLFPEHLKVSNPNSTDKKDKLVKPERYIDLETGICYKKVGEKLIRCDLTPPPEKSRGVLRDDE